MFWLCPSGWTLLWSPDDYGSSWHHFHVWQYPESQRKTLPSHPCVAQAQTPCLQSWHWKVWWFYLGFYGFLFLADILETDSSGKSDQPQKERLHTEHWPSGYCLRCLSLKVGRRSLQIALLACSDFSRVEFENQIQYSYMIIAKQQFSKFWF